MITRSSSLRALRGFMPARFLLERDYQRTEYEPACGLQLQLVGRLLNAVIEGAPPDPAFDHLLEQLNGPDAVSQPRLVALRR